MTPKQSLRVASMAAGFILAFIVVVNLFSYTQIPIAWQIAITTFILILPISFFLQSNMIEDYLVDERISLMRDQFYSVLISNRTIIEREKNRNLLSDSVFLDAYNNILNILSSEEIADNYSRAYDELLKLESTYDTEANLNKPEGKSDQNTRVLTPFEGLYFCMEAQSMARNVQSQIAARRARIGLFENKASSLIKHLDVPELFLEDWEKLLEELAKIIRSDKYSDKANQLKSLYGTITDLKDSILGIKAEAENWEREMDFCFKTVSELSKYTNYIEFTKLVFNFKITETKGDSSEGSDIEEILSILLKMEKFLIFISERFRTMETDIVQNNREVIPLYKKIRRRQDFIGLNLELEQEKIIKRKIQDEGLNFKSYLTPLSFLMIVYFAGMLVTIPLINSVFTGQPVTITLPLFDKSEIPFQVIQWGFLGGLVYTSINLLYRFLRKDFTPKIFIYGSFRIIYATITSIIIYFIYILPSQSNATTVNLETPTYILLICFAMGIAPIQFLIKAGESVYMRATQALTRDQPGKHSISANIVGINLITAERLNEEGISCIEHLAFCDPFILSRLTKIPAVTIVDWKDQALLYLFTAGVKLPIKGNTKKREILYDFINSKLGIRSFLTLSEFSETLSPPFQILEQSLQNSNLELSSDELGPLLQRVSEYEDKYFVIMKMVRELKDEEAKG